MIGKLRLVLACLVVLLTFTSCASSSGVAGRLVFVEPEPSANDSQPSVGSDSSSSQKTGTTGGSGASSKADGKASSGTSKSTGPASGSKSTPGKSGDSSAPTGSHSDPASSDVPDPVKTLTPEELITIYNAANQKNGALDYLHFDFKKIDSSAGTTLAGNLEYNNNFSSPVFIMRIPAGNYGYYCNEKQHLYYFTNSAHFQLTDLPCSSDTILTYIPLLNPTLTVGDVQSCRYESGGGGYVIHFELGSDAFAKYAPVFAIFSSHGAAAIQAVLFDYTVTAAGYIGSAGQIFSLSDGSSFEIDINYIDIGAFSSILQPWSS